ncbi:MAG TPA: class A beta-lactamase [Stellaceae bacterium]
MVHQRRATKAIARRTLLAVAPVFLTGATRAFAAAPSLRDYERAIGGRIGLFAENQATGARIAWRADERFHMCSTFKVSLAAAILVRVDRGQDRLDAAVRFNPNDIPLHLYAPVAKANLAKGALSVGELCQGAVELSDNVCANLLLARIGGPPALTAFWRATGDAVSREDNYEPVSTLSRSDEDTTTPAATAGTLRRLILGDVLSPASRERLTGWMRNCKTGLDLLRAGLPQGWIVADKTGNGGKAMLNDIAVAWPGAGQPLVICGYIDAAPDAANRVRKLMADIGALVGREIA